jgi:hypothetical protein
MNLVFGFFVPRPFNDSNHSHRNVSSDKAILNRGGPGFVFEERAKSVSQEH